MPRLAESHSSPNKKDRKPSAVVLGKRYISPAKRNEKYEEVENVIDQVYADICNGVSKFDCMQKLQKGVYGKELTKRNAYEYYNAAFDRLAVNSDIEAEKLRNLLYSRYETLLEECVNKGDMYNARGVLDSMAKIFLGVRENQTNIQLNNNTDGITINFGFNNES